MDVQQSYSVRRLLNDEDWRKRWLVKGLILIFLTLGIVLLACVPGEVRFSEKLDVYYPTHIGIGCAIWGPMSMFYAIAGLLLARQPPHKGSKEQESAKQNQLQAQGLQPEVGLVEAKVAKQEPEGEHLSGPSQSLPGPSRSHSGVCVTCGSPTSRQKDLEMQGLTCSPTSKGLSRQNARDMQDPLCYPEFKEIQEGYRQLHQPWAMFGLHLIRCVLNISLHIFSFLAISLTKRDPSVLLDQSRRAVAWFEGPVSIFAAFRLCFALMRWASGYTGLYLGPTSGLTLVRTIRIYGGFSVLRSLPQANLQAAGEKISTDIGRQQYLLATYHVCWWLFWTILAALAVLVKIAEVDFITEAHWWNWGLWNYLVLAGFLNALAGLQGDQTERELQAVCMHRFPQPDDPDNIGEMVRDFLTELAKQCSEKWQSEGAVVMLLIPREILIASMTFRRDSE